MFTQIKAMHAVALLLVLSAAGLAAPRQCVLAEHFTNTSCGPCATYNPGLHSVLNSMTRDTVIKISWHVWWPGTGDPFYVLNPNEVAARVNYYGVTGVPDIYMDGVLNPAMNDPTAIRSDIRSRAAISSPCSMQLWAAPSGATGVHYLIRATADQNMNSGSYRMYAVLVSDLISYSAPNGETSFPEPFRDAAPNAVPGQPFSITTGQSYEIEGVIARDASWGPENLSVIGFVQNASNQDIAQTEWADVVATSGSITLGTPNGGGAYFDGETQDILWSSASFSENVRIQINRAFPTGSWESISDNTANDGAYTWSVTGPTTTTARIRVTGTAHPLVGDSSETDFEVGLRHIQVLAANGGELWYTQIPYEIRWSSNGITGNVKIELRRANTGPTEILEAATANDGSHFWTPVGPVTPFARLIVSSLDFAGIVDSSDNVFVILDQPNSAPLLEHDALHDQLPGNVTLTAIVADDYPGFSTRLFYRLMPGTVFDSVAMAATGNPDEFAATLSLSAGRWEYFVRVVDSHNAVSLTDLYAFEVGAAGAGMIAYDDGTAEASQWGFDTGLQWAVKFDAPQTPYVVEGALIGISAASPDPRHQLLRVQLLNVDGGGMPGSLILEETVGSIGNVIGGIPGNPDNFTRVLFRDETGAPPVVNGAFCVAVANPNSGAYESILHDTSSARQHRSFVYVPCDTQWHNENEGIEQCSPGNRMIRATGFALLPPTVTAIRVGADIRLRWNSTQAPYYHVWSASTQGGLYSTFEGSATDTVFLDLGAISQGLKFYTVQSSTTP